MIKLVAFDLDGTIADTLQLCIRSLRQAISSVSPQVTDEDVIKTFGLNEEGMIEKLVADKDRDKVLQAFYACYSNLHPTMCPRPFVGIRKHISELRENGIIVALVTGKGECSCNITLRQFDMLDSFDKVLTGSAERNIKADALAGLSKLYQIPPDEMVYVGDTISDVTESKKVNVQCLSAAWNDISIEPVLQEVDEGNIFRSIHSLAKYLSNRCNIILTP